jgi:prohibitin 2
LKAVQVVANQTVVQAQAQARARVANATGEAQAIKLITEQLRQSLEYLQWKAINEWNGQLPYTFGGSGGFSSNCHNNSNNYHHRTKLDNKTDK